MVIKFFTCTLSCLYRKQDEDGIAQGGPMYFIECGLGKRFKPLAILFAMAGLVGCIPMFQVNQLASMLQNEFSIAPLYTGIAVGNSGVVMTAMSFNQSLPGIGDMIVYLVFTLFALSTMITYSYYSIKCARYLFGKEIGNKYIYIYLSILPMSAIWTQATIINIIDTMFALMIFPTLLSTLLLSRKVIDEMHRYFDKL
ncbi:MAG: Na+/alanine symporter [Gammaproteobacteria bacterium]|jgi:Na+/alanine symporter